MRDFSPFSVVLQSMQLIHQLSWVKESLGKGITHIGKHDIGSRGKGKI